MAIQVVPTFLQNASHSAAIFRQSASAPFVTGGVLAVGELTLTQQGTPNMSVVLGAGRAKVVGNSVSPPSGLSFTTQAMYDVFNDAPLTLTVAASNATNPRIDSAWIGVQDSYYSGAANQAVAGIVTGVPSSSPVAPAIPTNATLLGPIAVAANVTSIVAGNIGTQGFAAILRGAIAASASSAYYPLSPTVGQQVDDASLGYTLRWNGSQWKTLRSGLVPIIPTGVVGSTPATTNVVISATGKVTMSNVTNCQLQGVFTAEFDNYKILIDVDSMSADSSVYLRFALPGGTLNSVNYYSTVITAYSTGTPGSTLNSNVTSLQVGRIAASGGSVEIDVFRPALPKITRTIGQSYDNTLYLEHVGGTCSDLNQYDGLLFFSATTGINGNVRIYGYNNN